VSKERTISIATYVEDEDKSWVVCFKESKHDKRDASAAMPLQLGYP